MLGIIINAKLIDRILYSKCFYTSFILASKSCIFHKLFFGWVFDHFECITEAFSLIWIAIASGALVACAAVSHLYEAGLAEEQPTFLALARVNKQLVTYAATRVKRWNFKQQIR